MIRHLAALFRSGQARFRAETFGLYFPALPNRRRWWMVSPSVVRHMAHQLRGYARWHRTMASVARGGAHEWWGGQWPAIDFEGELRRRMREDQS